MANKTSPAFQSQPGGKAGRFTEATNQRSSKASRFTFLRCSLCEKHLIAGLEMLSGRVASGGLVPGVETARKRKQYE